MNMEPTTTDLAAYLSGYLKKCMQFEESKGKHRPSDFYGATEKGVYKNQEEAFFKIMTEAWDSTEAYWSVRKIIQQYQRDNGISGVVWKEVSYRGKTVRVPSVHDQLISVPGDKEILIAATPEILNWWAEVTEGMDLWKSVPPGDESVPIRLEQILVSAPLAEWAEVHLWDSPETNILCVETGERWVEPRLELNLELAWGTPEDVPYADHPESGSVWFSATRRNLDFKKLEDIFMKGSS